MSGYYFKVKTNDESKAGTNSDVYVKLYGEFGESEQIRIQKYIEGNGLERGNTDEFNVPFSEMGGNLGMIYKITVRSDHKGPMAGWMLGYINVTNITDDNYNNNTSKFMFDKWFLDTKTITREYDYITENKCTYKAVIEDYYEQPLSVGSNMTYTNEQTVTTKSEFTRRNVVTKESTTSFSADLSASISYDKAKQKALNLTPKIAAKGCVNLGFNHSTSKTIVDEAIDVEEKEVSLKESYEIENDSDKTKEYKVVYKIVRIYAIMEFGSVVAEFNVISRIVFAGVKDVETNKLVVASKEFATETQEQEELHIETV